MISNTISPSSKNPFGPFQWGSQCYVMGILNMTSDSFSGDGLEQFSNPLDSGLAQADSFLECGAHILDIGGQSTRPGAAFIDEAEELERTIPLIKGIRKRFPKAILSIDTYKPTVAKQAIEAGANIVNDIKGGRQEGMLAFLAQNKVPAILMHNSSHLGDVIHHGILGKSYPPPDINQSLSDIINQTHTMLTNALKAGLPKEYIMLDPGIGFGKSVAQNLDLIRHSSLFLQWGCPVLIGPSRKSFIGQLLNRPPNERLWGTSAIVASCALDGIDMVRVHDVKAMVDIVTVCNALRHQGD